jgi:glycosyltransferase involved in cell wall biosynthesis
MSKFFFIDTAVIELFVENGDVSGGAAVQTLVWMEGLLENGHEVLIAKPEGDKRDIKEEYKKFQTVTTYDENEGLRWLRWINYRLPRIFQTLKKTEVDYLYQSVPSRWSLIFSFMCKFLKIKYIIRISNDRHLDDRFRMVASRTNQWLLFQGLKQCDLILCQNNYQFEILSKKFPRKRILKIHNPIIVNYEFLRPKSNFEGPIAWLANFRHQKNLRLLYEIAEMMPKEQFKIAGVPFHPYDIESRTYVEKLGKLPNVEFLGKLNRNQILPFLASSKFLLSTSRYEGFSNTFLEAMVTGTPILTTKDVNPDGIIDNFGLGVVYQDINDLEEKISNLKKEEYFNMSFNCVDFVKENHDYKKLTQVLENKLQNI